MSAQVDVNVPRFNQAMVAGLIAVAFVVQWWPLVALVTVVLALTRFAGPDWGLFTQLYRRAVRPRLRGSVETEPAAPPRFAQLLGTVFLSGATGAFVAGWAVVGWVIALAVFVLAALAATTRLCVGCIIYERAVA